MDQYSPQCGRAEYLIAAARVLLVLSVALSTWLTPSHADWSEQVTYVLLGGYFAYAVGLYAVAFQTHIILQRLRWLTHVCDLAILSLLLYLSEIPVSAFFLYYMFSLACAALRWQWQGTLWTGSAALLVFIGIWRYRSLGLYDAGFELNHIVIGTSGLVMVTALLGYTESYRQRLHRLQTKLAVRPRAICDDPPILMRNMLTRAADMLQAPRVLMVWEELEEPWVYLALWSPEEFSWTREPPTAFDYIVANPLIKSNFFCPNAHTRRPKVLYTTVTGLRRWRGIPLHPNLHKQFAIETVLGLCLHSAVFEGYLFILDKPRIGADDLTLGELVAQQLGADLDQFHLRQQRQQMAIAEERLRLVRNLHDGLLQSLAGMALQLAEASRLQTENPQAAAERLVEVQHLLAEEQRDLRCLVSELKSTSCDAVEPHPALTGRLEIMRKRLQAQWGLRIELTIALSGAVLPASLSAEIYYIVHEALINVARHAYATVARSEISMCSDRVCITVTDDGCGFSFQGRYTSEALAYLNLGPVMLRQRIAALGGTLTLDSTRTGSRLEITIPLPPSAKPETYIFSQSA